MLSKINPYARLWIPAIVFMLVVLGWNNRSLSGDEPHYAVFANSIFQDLDLDLSNNYQNEKAERLFSPGNLNVHGFERDGRILSAHDLGLPVIISPLLNFIGLALTKMVLAAVVGLLLAVVSHRVILDAGVGKTQAWLISLGMCLALPFLPAAGLFYTELYYGLIAIFVLSRVSDENWILQMRSLFVIALLSVLLIFLHKRNVLPALVLVAWALFCTMLEYRRTTDLALLRLRLISLSPALLGFVYFYLYIFVYLDGNPTAVSISLRENMMLALMYHFDGSKGLFFLHPILLVGLWGIGDFLRSQSKRFVILWLGLYLSFLLPSTAVVALWGDWPMSNGLDRTRYGWPLALLWLFPTAHQFFRWGNRTETANLLWSLPILSLIYQFHLLGYWMKIDYFRFTWQGDWNPYALVLSNYLPSFSDFATYYRNPINYLVVVCAFVVAAREEFSRLWWQRIVLVGVLIAILISAEKANRVNFWFDKLLYEGFLPAVNLPGQVGADIWDHDLGHLVRGSDGRNGFLLAGGNQVLEAGEYAATLSARIPFLDESYVGHLYNVEVTANWGQVYLNVVPVTETDVDSNIVVTTLNFALDKKTNGVEVRVLYLAGDQAKVHLDKVFLTRVDRTP